MVRQFKLSSDSQINYSDVKENEWFAKNIAIAKANGVLPEIYNDTFEGNKAITREEMIYILYQAIVLNKVELEDTEGDMLLFDDVNKISEYAKEAAEYLVRKGIIYGDDNNKLNPTITSTRAEVTQILYNFSTK